MLLPLGRTCTLLAGLLPQRGCYRKSALSSRQLPDIDPMSGGCIKYLTVAC